MDEGGHRDNRRSRAEQYKAAQSQWLMQHHQPTMKQIMAIIAERDAAIQERNLALTEKKTAMAERDMAILQRDTAINERNNAIMERNNALSTLQYRETPVDGNNSGMSQIQTQFPSRCQIARGAKNMHHAIIHSEDDDQQVDETSYNSIDLQITETIPLSPVSSEAVKPRGNKRAKEPKSTSSSKKVQKKAKKAKIENNMFGKSHEWKDEHDVDNRSDDLGNVKKVVVSKSDWKVQDLGLNLVVYDDTTMPPPVCSCTGIFRQCYKWGNGGWQSSCCTTSISQYPLPSVPNKRHARVGGRKMSGGAYNKLLTRLSQEGHDLSNQVDLKENWAKHGTNRYITIK